MPGRGDVTLTEERTSTRIPPHDLEAEESLLGSMLLSRDAIADVVELKVEPVDYYKPAHGHVHVAVLALFSRGEPVDPVTVGAELDRQGLLAALGGRGEIMRLQSSTPASANAVHYARIVRDHARLRRLIEAGHAITNLGFSRPDDVHDTVEDAERLVFDIAQERAGGGLVAISDVLQRALDVIEARYDAHAELLGVPTGFRDYDALILGLQPSTLNIVAGRPAMGKSAFALGAALHVAEETRQPVAFFSFEMGDLDIAHRAIALIARIDTRKIMRGRLTEAEWTLVSRAVGRLAELPLLLETSGRGTVMEMRAKARRLKARHGALGLVVVDYLQLVTPTTKSRAGNREQEVAEISRGLKLLAMELECPVMALSQLNRALEQRADKRPTMADLRESGALENDADIVTGLYRDEVYNGAESDDRGLAEVIVLKHRNGPIGTVKLAFQSEYTRFANLARE